MPWFGRNTQLSLHVRGTDRTRHYSLSHQTLKHDLGVLASLKQLHDKCNGVY
jgi:hypothetical protein